MPQMRAMVLPKCGKLETDPLELRHIERHRIRNPSEVLIKIEACGVCHSQIHGIEGDWLDIGIPPVLPHRARPTSWSAASKRWEATSPSSRWATGPE